MAKTKIDQAKKHGGIKAMCGGRAAIVPADIIDSSDMANGPLRLFVKCCGHANKNGELWVSIARIAKDLGVEERTIYNWKAALEQDGLLQKLSPPGKKGFYRVIRHPDQRRAAQLANLTPLAKRKEVFGVYGKMGAYARQQRVKKASETSTLNESSPAPRKFLQSTEMNEIAPITGPVHKSPNIRSIEGDSLDLPHREFSIDSCLQNDINALAQIPVGQSTRPYDASKGEPDIDWGDWTDYLCKSRLQPDEASAWEWLLLATGTISAEGDISDDQAQRVLDGVLRVARMRDANSSLLHSLIIEAISNLTETAPSPGG